MISLVNRDAGVAQMSMGAPVKPDGSFAFSNVAPGVSFEPSCQAEGRPSARLSQDRSVTA